MHGLKCRRMPAHDQFLFAWDVREQLHWCEANFCSEEFSQCVMILFMISAVRAFKNLR